MAPKQRIGASHLVFCLMALFAAVSSALDQQPEANNASTSAPALLRFEPFRASEQYRCGTFAAQGRQNDAAMRLLQRAQNALIRALSRPFPHQKLLSDEALLGQREAWHQSLVDRRDEWVQFEQWWLVAALVLLAGPALFLLCYLCYRCVSCCCRARRKQKQRRADRRLDGWRRALGNAAIAILIVANVFCAAILLINTQYAQYGLDELPTRLHYCVNDVLIYRTETVERIRKLLRDDFYVLNGSLHRALDGAGEAVVQRLKQATGADQLDDVVAKANNAGALAKAYEELARELPAVLDARHSLEARLRRVQHARDGLVDCERSEREGAKAALCHQARQALKPVLELARTEQGVDQQADEEDDWEGEQRPRELSHLLPEELPASLRAIEALDLSAQFAPMEEGSRQLERGIQTVVDSRRGDADERLRLLDRTLHALHEQIAGAIKSVNLRFLDEQLVEPMMRQRDQYRQWVHAGWVGALVVSGLFAFLALAFLLGLCYGCCGRRPSEYDDDCCVRSTGASFFSCSIWLSLLLIPLFGVLSALAMLVGANSYHLVCHPVEEPLAREDMLSLLDRFVSLYRLDAPSSSGEEESFSASFNSLLSEPLFTAQRRPRDLIRDCARGQTLYTMFGMDKKFKLTGQKGLDDEYQGLSDSIRQFLVSGQALDGVLASSGGGRGRDKPNNGLRLFSAQMRSALERLGAVQLPQWNGSAVRDFCAQRPRFALEGPIAELRHLQQQSGGGGGEKEAVAATNELNAVIDFLEEHRTETVQVRAQLEGACARLEQLHAGVDALRFNASALLANLERVERELHSEQQLRVQLREVAQLVADDVLARVRAYADHVNASMATEVTGCAPLADIVQHTRLAICDCALNPLNSLWLALAVGLLLLVPIIVLASWLNPLYLRTQPYLKYIVPSSESPNEATFATDIYGLVGHQQHGAGAGSTFAARHGPTKHGGYQTIATQITSPYATANYGYQELYPPIYSASSAANRR